MPPRVKNTCPKKHKETFSDLLNKEKGNQEVKENKGLEEKCKLGLECENVKDKLFKSPLKEKVNLKPLGFWSQKLKNLESENSFTKPKKLGLYEFSETETDETGSPYKRKKKVKRKPGPRKKKQPQITKPVEKPKAKQSVRKIKEIHSQSLFKEQFALNKEREKLADKGKKFTFLTGMTSLGITSTPAVNKDNLVGASNFLFLSPIINEECANGSTPQCTPVRKSKIPDTSVKFETPKVAERRISCRRVLRNGKIL